MFCLHALESGERAEEMPFSLEKEHSRKLSSVQFADRNGNRVGEKGRAGWGAWPGGAALGLGGVEGAEGRLLWIR